MSSGTIKRMGMVPWTGKLLQKPIDDNQIKFYLSYTHG
jgi:hypothetical protein